MPVTDNVTSAQVSDAIKTIAAAALPVTKIIPQNIWGMDEGGFGRLMVTGETLKSPSDSNRINALAFWRQSTLPNDGNIAALRTGPAAAFDPARLTTPGKLLVEVWQYEFRLLFAYASGSNAANSTRDFDTLIDTLSAALGAKPKLGIESYRIEGHSGLYWQSLSVQSNNDLKIHDASGILRVMVHKPLTPS
jgi:hypothetical protein